MKFRMQLFLMTAFICFCCLFFYSKVEAKTWNFVAIEYSANSRDKTHHTQGQYGILKGYTSFKVSSVSDMITQIQSKMAPDDRIGTLEIRGHGRPGIQAVGGGAYSYRQPDKSIRIDNKSEWQNSLAPLKGRFESDGKIRLLGCRVGANEEGAQLLYELQIFLETDAEGAVDYMFALFQGNYDEYGDVQLSQYPSSDPPESMAPSWLLESLAAFLLSQSIPTLSEWKQIFLTLLMLSFVMAFIYRHQPGLTSNAVSFRTQSAQLQPKSFCFKLFQKVMSSILLLVALGFSAAILLQCNLSSVDIVGTLFCAPVFGYIIHLVILCTMEYRLDTH